MRRRVATPPAVEQQQPVKPPVDASTTTTALADRLIREGRLSPKPQDAEEKAGEQRGPVLDFGDDLNPPDAAKLLVQLAPWLVAEKSDASNWTLLERHRMESGKNVGRYAWKAHGYHASPGQAATRGIRLLVERELGPGAHALEAVAKATLAHEVRLRDVVEPAVREETRAKVLAEVLGVMKCPEDKKRVQRLIDGKPV